MKRLFVFLAVLAFAGTVTAYLTTPETIDPAKLAGITPDITFGEQVFAEGGCASCHSAPKAEGVERLKLGGGRAFPSDFGTFYAPNISPDTKTGIGNWGMIDLVNAMRFGTSPDNTHYYPVFPYGSFNKASLKDIVSLYGYLMQLPAVQQQNRPHDVKFPFNIRATLGVWKALFLSGDPVLNAPTTPEVRRGQYLVEGLGHCAECHTPRNLLGGLKRDRWLAGAPNPSGRGTIPNITPAKLNWDVTDIVAYFTTGLTPEFDSAGGEMAEVIENLSQLPESDLMAIAAYLKAIPAVE
ncbi:c-type cytochrome [Profundibacter sp.]|uniref:c-type cytochrome n=1 Tax=Profundibacter sp. TaxID=3101071 RepID=UPI003D0B1D18